MARLPLTVGHVLGRARRPIIVLLHLYLAADGVSAQPNLIVDRARTSVTLSSTHTALTRPGDVIFISGRVTPAFGSLPTVVPVHVSVRHPDGFVEYNSTFLTDASGSYQFPVTVRTRGHISVEVRAFVSSLDYRAATSEMTIPIEPDVGMAIVVAGAGAREPLDYLSDNAVRAFRRIGILDETCGASCAGNRIWYMHPDTAHDLDGDGESDVDETPTLANLQHAIRVWAAALIQTRDASGALSTGAVLSTPLTVYLIGEYDASGFHLADTERLTPAALGAYLDALDQAIDDAFVAGGAAPPDYVPINVIIEGPSSGSFIPQLSRRGRVILTSTDTYNQSTGVGGVSYMASGGSLSFSAYFLSRIATGHYIHPSFAHAQLDILSNSQTARQKPQVEATGNGVANEIADELAIASVPLEERPSGDARPRIMTAFGQVTLRDIPAALLWAYVDDPEDAVTSVEAVILPPPGSFEETHVVALAESATPNRWDGVYERFAGSGSYTVIYTARDAAGNAARSVVKSVIVLDATAPLDVTQLRIIQAVNDTITLRWSPSESRDTQGYRIYRTEPGGVEELVADAGNVDRFTVTGVPWATTGGRFRFRVTAYDRVPLENFGPQIAIDYVAADGADLAVSIVAGPDPVELRNPVLYTVTVLNLGPHTATSVVVNSVVSGGQTELALTATNCFERSDTTSSCNLGTLAVGESTSFTYETLAEHPGAISITSSVSADQPDGNVGNNAAIETVTVNPPPAFSGFGTATIDGILSRGEWTYAACHNLYLNLPHGGITPAAICAMNDDVNMYFALRFNRAFKDQGNSFTVEIDADHDGVMEEGDDVFLYNGNRFVDDFRTRSGGCSGGLCGFEDAGFGGTTDGTGALVNNGVFSVYEMSHPLNSGDLGRDLAASLGDSVGFFISVRMIGPGSTFPDDFGDTDYPAFGAYATMTFVGESVSQAVDADDSIVTTDTEGDGATPGDQIETTVFAAGTGTVTIEEGPASGSAPHGYRLLDYQVVISAPPAPGRYFTIEFRIDPSAIVPPLTAMNIQIERIDGAGTATLIPNCGSPITVPCVSRGGSPRVGDVVFTVFTHTASTWRFLADVMAPVITVPESFSLEATSATGALVVFDVLATDNIGIESVSCAPFASGDFFPMGATTITCTATDGSGNAQAQSFVVTVTAPNLADLLAQVRGLSLPATMLRALTATVQAADLAARRGRIHAARLLLHTFELQVRAFERAGRLPPEVADALIATADLVAQFL